MFYVFFFFSFLIHNDEGLHHFLGCHVKVDECEKKGGGQQGAVPRKKGGFSMVPFLSRSWVGRTIHFLLWFF